jgi:hypothetical protein
VPPMSVSFASPWQWLCTLHLSIHSALYTLHSALYTLHSALCTLHSALCTLHSALCTLHSSIYVQSHPFQNDEVIINKKEEKIRLPFCYLASKFNHKTSLFKRQKATNFRMAFQNVNRFNSMRRRRMRRRTRRRRRS